MADACPGCQAREGEIAYLRSKVDALTDQALAAANPTLYLSLKNPTPVQDPIHTSFQDDAGRTYVVLDGKAVPKEMLDEFVSKVGGFLDGEGRVIPADEYNRAMDKLQRDMGGGFPEPPSH